MPTNSYVHWWNDANEQNLLQELMTEAIQFHGFDVVYLPRSMRREDTFYNEDVLSLFTQTYPIEVYLKNVLGWEGQGDFLSKFGLQVDDKITVMISRDRFNELIPRARFTRGQISADAGGTTITGTNSKFKTDLRVGDDLTTTSSGQTRTVTAIKNNTSLTVSTAFDISVEMEYFSVPLADDIKPEESRPMEGDLVYMPAPFNAMMEVKFVVHERAAGQFYPLGKKTFYEVQLELYTYSHETIATGDSDIDVFQNEVTYTIDLSLGATGSGSYVVGETVYQGSSVETSTATGVVTEWDADNHLLRLSTLTGTFANSIAVIGQTSGASYVLSETPDALDTPNDPNDDNAYIATQDDDIIDTRETNRITGV
jgi:hypothetical protein